MKEYPHIDTIFKRDPTTGKIILGSYSTPEFEYLANKEWVFTEKVDGTNIRVMFSSDPLDNRIRSVTFGGKTDKAQIPTKLFNHLNQIFTKEIFDEVFPFDEGPTNICLYGEGCGAGIQKGGGNYSQEQKFVLFDVKIGPWWLRRDSIIDIAEKLNLVVVPISFVGTLSDAVEFVKEGFTSHWGDFTAEGLVGQPTVLLFNRKGERIITKIKHKDFQ